MGLIESYQVSSDCMLIAYDCTLMYANMEFNELIKASMRHFHRSAAPNLRKQS